MLMVMNIEAVQLGSVSDQLTYVPVLFGCHFGGEEQLIYVTEYHEQIEAQVGETGGVEWHLLVRRLLGLGFTPVIIVHHLRQRFRLMFAEAILYTQGRAGSRNRVNHTS